MEFSCLPKDLKNVITDFAFGTTWEIVKNDLKVCGEIKNMNLSPVLTRFTMWSHKYDEYMPDPLRQFEPICNLTGSWIDFIDWSAVREILFRLDYRRKWVNFLYSRDEWLLLFNKNWKNIAHFDSFFRFLINTRIDCLKPLWKACGFDCLKSYNTPFRTGRWWLNAGFGEFDKKS